MQFYFARAHCLSHWRWRDDNKQYLFCIVVAESNNDNTTTNSKRSRNTEYTIQIRARYTNTCVYVYSMYVLCLGHCFVLVLFLFSFLAFGLINRSIQNRNFSIFGFLYFCFSTQNWISVTMESEFWTSLLVSVSQF